MDHVTMSETGRMDSVSSELVEPKTEPEMRPESPMIRVCDTPSSTRSMHSPSGDVIIIIIIIIMTRCLTRCLHSMSGDVIIIIIIIMTSCLNNQVMSEQLHKMC